MNCDCIKEFEAKMIEQGHNGKEVVEADMENVAMVGMSLKIQMSSKMKLTYKTGKSVKANVYFNHCPFCGKLYNPKSKKAK